MLAQILVHEGVILPPHGQFDQQVGEVIIRVLPRFPLGRLSAVLPCLWRNLPIKPKMRLCRPIGRGAHAPHELFQLRHRLLDMDSCWEFGEWRQLFNLRPDTQVRLIDWVHLLQSFEEVAPARAPPDSALDLPLKKLIFARLFYKRAMGLDISMLLTREEQNSENSSAHSGRFFGANLRSSI